MVLAEFGTGQVFWSMLWFFMFFLWIWLLVMVLTDVFRSEDLHGWAKALWTVFVIVLPYLGVFVYLIARGHKMGEHAAAAYAEQEAATRTYIQGVVASDGVTTADQLAKLADLRDRGAIDDTEFEGAKARILGTTATPAGTPV